MNSRFSLNVKFAIYGEEYEWSCSLNWSADSPDQIDPRITEWFLGCHDKAYAKWQAKISDMESEFRAAETKARELAELKRLREKYPDA
jgi:hypothetical protein